MTDKAQKLTREQANRRNAIVVRLSNELNVLPGFASEREMSIWNALVTAELAAEGYRKALEHIAEADETCQCDHMSPDCCNKAGVYCAVCIAGAALAQPKEGQ